MFSLIKLIVLVAIVGLAAGVYMTIKVQSASNPYQKQFLAGTVGGGLPDGFYRGSADFGTFSWQGKQFDAAGMTGMNVFGTGTSTHQQYPFTLSMAKGIRDTGTQVVQLDYNRPENPFWLRPVLDEMTETASGSYIGKIHYRLIPFFPFSIAYFKMQK